MGASGSFSTTYLPLAHEMIGTPGIFRILFFKALSLQGISIPSTSDLEKCGRHLLSRHQIHTVLDDTVDNAVIGC
jgi:hypothetical protein